MDLQIATIMGMYKIAQTEDIARLSFAALLSGFSPLPSSNATNDRRTPFIPQQPYSAPTRKSIY
jgi:hypothetical protein